MRLNSKFVLSFMVVLVVSLFLINNVSAQGSILDEENVSMDIKAKTCLIESNQTINELFNAGFNTQRSLDLNINIKKEFLVE